MLLKSHLLFRAAAVRAAPVVVVVVVVIPGMFGRDSIIGNRRLVLERVALPKVTKALKE